MDEDAGLPPVGLFRRRVGTPDRRARGHECSRGRPRPAFGAHPARVRAPGEPRRGRPSGSRRSQGTARVSRRELGVGVVCETRDVRLRLALDEVHVRRREREDLGVDADAVHVLDALGRVGHRRGHAEEPRALEANDPLTRGARPEREIAAASLDALEIRRRVVVVCRSSFTLARR